MNHIQKYFQYRQNLIDQYVKGDMTKNEYLLKNFDAVLNLRDKPFQYPDNIDKCLFNYQYYNAMAKEAKMNSSSLQEQELRYSALDTVNYYYAKKDKATLQALKLMEFKDVEAYFIKVRSKILKGKLFEIVIDPYDMILHSANTSILNKLRFEGVFSEEVRISKIDGYINQKY